MKNVTENLNGNTTNAPRARVSNVSCHHIPRYGAGKGSQFKSNLCVHILNTHKRPERAFCVLSRLEIFFAFLTITFSNGGWAV